jgi:hypothetical protein
MHYLICQLRIKCTLKCGSAKIKAEKARFPRENGVCKESEFFEAREIPRKTTCQPEGINSESLKNAGKSRLFGGTKNGKANEREKIRRVRLASCQCRADL